MIDFCIERELCVGNIYLKHKSLHKYPKVARGQDGMEVMTMIDLPLAKKDMLPYVQDKIAVRGMGRVLSDHYVVLCQVKLEDA